MEKEIQVRKKRFAAFWMAGLLLCILTMPPMAQKAGAYELSGSVTGQSVSLGEPLIYSEVYTVVYQDQGGNQIQSIPVGYDETHYVLDAAEANLTLAASETLTGWKITATVNDSGYIDTVYLSPTIEIQYTIQFVNEDGTVLQSSQVASGAIPSYTGATPTKAATAQHTYAFAGWTPEIVAAVGDATYTAVYTETAARYTITFDTDGGSEIGSITQDYGSAVTAPPDPTKTGYSFAGWDQTIPTTMPGEDLTITAQWIANTYYIHYELYGGTNGNNPPTYTYGEGVASFADAVKESNTFAGWYSDAAFTTGVKSISTTQTGDITLYAKFEPVTTVIEAGTYDLKAGVQYQLGSVTKVSGDSSVYTPGSTFYVPADGSYTFR